MDPKSDLQPVAKGPAANAVGRTWELWAAIAKEDGNVVALRITEKKKDV